MGDWAEDLINHPGYIMDDNSELDARPRPEDRVENDDLSSVYRSAIFAALIF